MLIGFPNVIVQMVFFCLVFNFFQLLDGHRKAFMLSIYFQNAWVGRKHYYTNQTKEWRCFIIILEIYM